MSIFFEDNTFLVTLLKSLYICLYIDYLVLILSVNTNVRKIRFFFSLTIKRIIKKQ